MAQHERQSWDDHKHPLPAAPHAHWWRWDGRKHVHYLPHYTPPGGAGVGHKHPLAAIPLAGWWRRNGRKNPYITCPTTCSLMAEDGNRHTHTVTRVGQTLAWAAQRCDGAAASRHSQIKPTPHLGDPAWRWNGRPRAPAWPTSRLRAGAAPAAPAQHPRCRHRGNPATATGLATGPSAGWASGRAPRSTSTAEGGRRCRCRPPRAGSPAPPRRVRAR